MAAEKAGFTSMFFGGVPHQWLVDYMIGAQKFKAYPYFFFDTNQWNQIHEARKYGFDPGIIIPDDYDESLLAYANKLKDEVELDDGIASFFGYNENIDDPWDLGTLGALYDSARPTWVRLWTTVQQHKRTKDAIVGIKEGEEVGRRTYIVGNNLWPDYSQWASDFGNPDGAVRSQLEFDSNEDLNTWGLINPMADFIPREGFTGNHLWMKPMAKIKDVSVDVMGKYLGATKKATVTFDVYSREDFYNIYQRYFLTPGAQLVVDIGRANVQPYDIAEMINLKNDNPNLAENELGELDLKMAKIRYGNGKQNPANMDTFIGKVTKFDSKMTKDKWECSVTLMSKNSISLNANTENDTEFSQKFINRLDTYAVMTTLESTLPQEIVKDIWNVNWLDTSGIDDLVAMVGNTSLSGQFVLRGGDKGDSPNYAVQTSDLGESSVTIAAPNKYSQRKGVYVQRLHWDPNQDLSSIGNPKLNDNVYVSIKWIETNLLNPLIEDDAHGLKEDSRNIFKGTFKTKKTQMCNFSINLARQRQFAKKTRYTFKWLYGMECSLDNIFYKQKGGTRRQETLEGAMDDYDSYQSVQDKMFDEGLAKGYQMPKFAQISNLFVHSSVVKEAMAIHNRVRDIYLYILNAISEDSGHFMDLQIMPGGENCSSMQVVDVNFDSEAMAVDEEYLASYEDLEYEIAIGNLNEYQTKPIISPYQPGTLVKDIDFGFNIASDKQASMIAIQGASGNQAFSLNNAAVTSRMKGLTQIFGDNMDDPGYGWKYLPQTDYAKPQKKSRSALEDYTFGWHEHVNDALNQGSAYQGMTEFSKSFLLQLRDKFTAEYPTKKIAIEKLEELNGGKIDEKVFEDLMKVLGGDGSKFAESWTQDQRDKLLDKVGKLKEDVIKKKQDLFELEPKKTTTEIIETDEGAEEKWVYAKDLFTYYDLRHKKSLVSNNLVDPDKITRYNPPIAGMSLSLTLSGMHGWKIGDSFRLDELPDDLVNKVYFIVTGVKQKVTGNGNWTTELKCIYKVRPELKFSKDYDFVSSVYKNTYIGIDPAFVKSLGYSQEVADMLKRWKPMNLLTESLIAEDGSVPEWISYDDIGLILNTATNTQTFIDFFHERETSKAMLANQKGDDVILSKTDIDMVEDDPANMIKLEIVVTRDITYQGGGRYISTAAPALSGPQQGEIYKMKNNKGLQFEFLDGDEDGAIKTKIFTGGNGMWGDYASEADIDAAFMFRPTTTVVESTANVTDLGFYLPPAEIVHDSWDGSILLKDVVELIKKSKFFQDTPTTLDAVLVELGTSEARYNELKAQYNGAIPEWLNYNQFTKLQAGGKIPLPEDAQVVFKYVDTENNVIGYSDEYDDPMNNTQLNLRSLRTFKPGAIGGRGGFSDLDDDTHIQEFVRALNENVPNPYTDEFEEESDTETFTDKGAPVIEEPAAEPIKINEREPNPYKKGTPAHKMYENGMSTEEINQAFRGVCFDGFGKVLMADESYKLVKDIKVGDKVKSETGVVTISKIDTTSVDTFTDHYVDDEIKFYEYNDIQLTFGHWININNKWEYPKNIKNTVLAKPKDTYMYNFHLEENEETDLVYLDDELFPQFFGEKNNFYINDVLVSSTSNNVQKIAEYLDKLRVKYNISFLDANSENNTNLTNEEKEEIRKEIKSFIKNLK